MKKYLFAFFQVLTMFLLGTSIAALTKSGAGTAITRLLLLALIVSLAVTIVMSPLRKLLFPGRKAFSSRDNGKQFPFSRKKD